MVRALATFLQSDGERAVRELLNSDYEGCARCLLETAKCSIVDVKCADVALKYLSENNIDALISELQVLQRRMMEKLQQKIPVHKQRVHG